MRTFQNVRLFKGMTVLENLLVAQHHQSQAPLLAGLFNTARYRRSEAEKIDQAMHWLDVMGLREFVNREAGNLAYGHQRRLEIARCMITKPRLLMLDEPAAGLNPQEKKDLQALIDQAAHVPKARRPTRPTRGSVTRRLEGKARHSAIKAGRRRVD